MLRVDVDLPLAGAAHAVEGIEYLSSWMEHVAYQAWLELQGPKHPYIDGSWADRYQGTLDDAPRGQHKTADADWHFARTSGPWRERIGERDHAVEDTGAPTGRGPVVNPAEPVVAPRDQNDAQQLHRVPPERRRAVHSNRWIPTALAWSSPFAHRSRSYPLYPGCP